MATLSDMTHLDLLTTIAHRVREAGAAAALADLRAERPHLTAADLSVVAYHDTLAVFYVWAVDRLVEAGLDDTRILWHPLTDPRSALAWWDAATLAGPQAAARFVPSTRALPGEPVPSDLVELVAA